MMTVAKHDKEVSALKIKHEKDTEKAVDKAKKALRAEMQDEIVGLLAELESAEADKQAALAFKDAETASKLAEAVKEAFNDGKDTAMEMMRQVSDLVGRLK
jgi:type IV pilus biogenesis protein CpaD/CtpE